MRYLISILLIVSALQAEPKALREAKSKYTQSVLKLTRKHIQALEKIKKDLTKKGDLDGALLTRDEMARLAKEIEGLSKKAEDTSDDKEKAAAVKYRNHKYRLFKAKDNISWHEAEERCRRAGGYLVTVNDVSENKFLTKLIVQAGVKNAWLGATDASSEGKWRGASGSSLRYKNWWKGAEKGNHRNWAYLRPAGNWGQANNNPKMFPIRYYICEWNK